MFSIRSLYFFPHLVGFVHGRLVVYLAYLPGTHAINGAAFFGLFQAVEEATETIDGTLHPTARYGSQRIAYPYFNQRTFVIYGGRTSDGSALYD